MILTPSGMRGQVNLDLSPEKVFQFTQSFALWLGKGSTVVVGRDTRNSSIMFSNVVVSALCSMGVHVIDIRVSPTPVILHYIRIHALSGGIVITGSHNPEDYNGIKFVGPSQTFIDNFEIEEIQKLHKNTQEVKCSVKWDELGTVSFDNAIKTYSSFLNLQINDEKIRSSSLKVILDTNAGAATGVINKLLSQLGCNVKSINTRFSRRLKDKSRSYPHFPRKIEPIAENLQDIKKKVQIEHADVGFAFDCDADRVTVIGPNGKIYPEDITVLLPLYYLLSLNRTKPDPKKVFVVTNIASSLAFNDIVKKFGGEIVRTSIGEQYLAKKLAELKKKNPKALILGGEGSSGGFMFPEFNNARDGIFATCKIVEMLANDSKNLTELVSEIPQYYSSRESIPLKKPLEKMKKLPMKLDTDKIQFKQIGNDIKISDKKNSQWLLIHPSNTEPVVRIIAESKDKKTAEKLVKKYRTLLENLG